MKDGRGWVKQSVFTEGLRETLLVEPNWGGKHTVKGLQEFLVASYLRNNRDREVISLLDLLTTTAFGDISLLNDKKRQEKKSITCNETSRLK